MIFSKIINNQIIATVIMLANAAACAQVWTPIPANDGGPAMTWKPLCAATGQVGTWSAFVACSTGFTAAQFSARCSGTYSTCTGRCGPVVWSHSFINNTSQTITVKGATTSSTSLNLIFYANGSSTPLGSYPKGTNTGSWDWLPGLNFTVRGGSSEACVSGGWVELHLSNGKSIRGTATSGGIVFNGTNYNYKYDDTVTISP